MVLHTATQALRNCVFLFFATGATLFCAAAEELSVLQWHPATILFSGPETSESADINPFTDYRLLVTFVHAESSVTVRGFYAADGNAAESGSNQGNVWQVRFGPDRIGEWTYKAELRHGSDIAISDDPNSGELVPIDRARGSFLVTGNEPNSALADFRTRGRLVADDGYLRFSHSNERWLKAGTDSPENLLGYADFDGTWRISAESSEGEAKPTKDLHRYAPHIRDWKQNDPSWRNGKGKGLIGGLNYLSSVGMNSIYFLTLNIGGDGKDVWPYVSPEDFTRFDCSKLDQWEVVFSHMQRCGILMHVVTQETENERMLDDGDTGRLRKLYYRELIARFAHHPALIWNLGEENGPADFSPDGQTSVQQRAMAAYLKKSDPYKHPVVIHTHSTTAGKDEILPHLLNHAPLDGLSFQVDKRERVNRELADWRERSRAAGQAWLIGMDEIGIWHTGVVPDKDDAEHDDLRRHVLWGGLMAGAYGVEWYFGAKFPHNDLTSEDWRQRANMWKQTKIAADFFEEHLPYWEMQPAQELTSSTKVYGFAKVDAVYVFYVPRKSPGGTESLKLTLESAHEFNVRWFDPVNGGALQKGTKDRVSGGKRADPGRPPDGDDRDWVLFLRR